MKATNRLLIVLVFIAALLLAGCNPRLRVGELQTGSQVVELGGAESVRVDINMGAGNLQLTGGAEKLLEADFTYNVAGLKPEVELKNETLVVRQPDGQGMPDLQGVTDFRNEWVLRLNDETPMDLNVKMGGGSGDLRLAGLSLTGLDVNLGAGDYTIDLRGEWAADLNVTVEAGAANIRLRLPSGVGVRVEIGDGPHTVEAKGMRRDGNVYTNAAYGESEVTLQANVEAGIGLITLGIGD